MAAFIGGVWYAHGYAGERFTLLELNGKCPRCTTDIRDSEPHAFRAEESIDCPGCRQVLLLAMD